MANELHVWQGLVAQHEGWDGMGWDGTGRGLGGKATRGYRRQRMPLVRGEAKTVPLVKLGVAAHVGMYVCLFCLLQCSVLLAVRYLHTTLK